MRYSAIALAVVVLLVAACGGDAAVTTSSTTAPAATSLTTAPTSSTTEPTTTTTSTSFAFEEPPTTEPVDVDPQFVLYLDGFAGFGLLGDEAAAVIAAFDDGFGPATADSGWLTEHGCAFPGPMRTITWIEPGVRLVFVDGESGYGTGPHLASYTTLLPVDPPWELAGGIRRGMTLEEVVTAFPDAEVVTGEALDSIRLVPGTESFASIDAAGEIREFWAGDAYC